MRIVKTWCIVLFFATPVAGQTSQVQVNTTPLSYSSGSLKLSFNAGFTFGPPAPPFLGAWISGTSGDTLVVHPIYNAHGPFGQFVSGRYDTVVVNIPNGINKVRIHPSLRIQGAIPYDTLYSLKKETLVLSSLNTNDFVSKGITIHPNPVSPGGQLYLETDIVSNNGGSFNLVISTINGSTVYNEVFQELPEYINVGNWSSGEYILVIQNGQEVLPIQFIIE